MTPAQFHSRVKDPRCTWEEVETALSRLNPFSRAFFEDGHAQPLVMRALRDHKGQWLLDRGWDPSLPFQTGRRQLPRDCDWISQALAGNESVAIQRLVSFRALNGPKFSWLGASAKAKNLPGVSWILDTCPGQNINDAWWEARKVSWREGVDFMVSRGVDVDAPDKASGKTALHLSIEASDVDFSLFLLGRGANPNATDGKGTWAASGALQKNSPDILRALIEAGLKLDLPLPRGNTWVSLAHIADSPDCAKLLIEAGAPLSKRDAALLPHWRRMASWQGVIASLDARALGDATTGVVSVARPARRI